MAEEIDTVAGEIDGQLEAIGAELADVECRLENLYQALETRQLPIEVLSPRILALKSRQDQLTAAREDTEAQLERRRADLRPPRRKSSGMWPTSESSSRRDHSRSGRRSSATSSSALKSLRTRPS